MEIITYYYNNILVMKNNNKMVEKTVVWNRKLNTRFFILRRTYGYIPHIEKYFVQFISLLLLFLLLSFLRVILFQKFS